jgi:hypothetical protein
LTDFALLFAHKTRSMSNARHFIEDLLTKGKLEAAIEGCLILVRHYGDQERGGMVAQHSARYHTLMTDYHAGTINDDDYRLERARINRAMLDLVHSIPADWTDDSLIQAGFSARAFDKATGQQQKSFLEKWGLVLGIVASLMGILGVTLREIIFQKKEDPVAQTAESKTGSNAPQPTEQTMVKEPQKTDAPGSKTTATQTKVQSKKLPDATIPSANSGASPQAIPDKVFRSFSRLVIADDMELGKIGAEMAFRNVKTKELLCCFKDAESFMNGKAWVSKDGINYYYIDPRGNKVK